MSGNKNANVLAMANGEHNGKVKVEQAQRSIRGSVVKAQLGQRPYAKSALRKWDDAEERTAAQTRA